MQVGHPWENRGHCPPKGIPILLTLPQKLDSQLVCFLGLDTTGERDWGLERDSNLPEVIEQVSHRTGIQIQVFCFAV